MGSAILLASIPSSPGELVNQYNHSRQIQVAGRSIRCDSVDDRALLSDAKTIAEDPSTANGI
jgi:hypothetical protein